MQNQPEIQITTRRWLGLTGNTTCDTAREKVHGLITLVADVRSALLGLLALLAAERLDLPAALGPLILAFIRLKVRVRVVQDIIECVARRCLGLLRERQQA
jgi:hypothetical protein